MSDVPQEALDVAQEAMEAQIDAGAEAAKVIEETSKELLEALDVSRRVFAGILTAYEAKHGRTIEPELCRRCLNRLMAAGLLEQNSIVPHGAKEAVPTWRVKPDRGPSAGLTVDDQGVIREKAAAAPEES